MIGIVDYGLGNVRAIANIYEALKIEHCLASTPEAIERADKLILPGVGAFDWAMECLQTSNLRAELDRQVLERRKPVLGICVGMQMMARRSDEGTGAGLGWIDGEILHLAKGRPGSGRIALPHMGWNDVIPVGHNRLFEGLDDWRFYFLHSYFFHPLKQGIVIADASYHGDFACAFCDGNVHGLQFHPEKSHHWGVRLLTNFAEL